MKKKIPVPSALKTIRRSLLCLPALVLCAVLLAGCAAEKKPELEPWTLPEGKGSRNNEPVCLVPEATGKTVYENEYASIDASNASEGYICATYLGENPKVKLRIMGEDEVLYTYDLNSDHITEVFPLSSGDGKYEVFVYEQAEGTRYDTAHYATFSVTLRDEFLPFLYPNQYVKFDASDEAIAKGVELAAPAESDLDVVSNVYNYIIRNVTYDVEKAETVPYGYLPDIDETLSTGKGICLDYAALMTAMLRSQQIPTRMEIGYAGQAYHAWLSSHIDGVGWVNGLIHFDGTDWSLMDPTFASSNSADYLESFIGDGDNYVLKFVY